MNQHKDDEFLCIDYPGIVSNVDTALDTMGGLKVITKHISLSQMRNRRANTYSNYLPLNYQGNNNSENGCLMGDIKHLNNCYLARIKRKRNRGDEDEETTANVQILGSIKHLVTYENRLAEYYINDDVNKKQGDDDIAYIDELDNHNLIPSTYEPA